jgi:hypothetical protein
VDYLLLFLQWLSVYLEPVYIGGIFLEAVEQPRSGSNLSNRSATVVSKGFDGDFIHSKARTSYIYIIVFI